MNTIKIAQVGCTRSNAKQQLAAFSALREVEAIILCDADLAAAESLRASAPDRVEAAVDRLDAVLSRLDVQFVSIAVPNAEAPSVISAAARAGKNILCEPPAAVSAAALKPALDDVARAGVMFAVNFNNRQSPALCEMQRQISNGAIGHLLSVELRAVTTQPCFLPEWELRRTKNGAGVLNAIGCHYLDLARWLTGIEITAVAAQCAANTGAAGDVEDTAMCVLRFANGALGSLHAGCLLAREKPPFDNAVVIRGAQGSLTFDPGCGKDYANLRIDTVNQTRDIQFQHSRTDQAEFLRECVQAAAKNEPMPTGADSALAVRRILDACYASAAPGRMETV